MADKQDWIGGSFAPPMTDHKLTRYRELANECEDARVKEAVLKLADMVEFFQKTPESKEPGKLHPTGKMVVVPLAKAEVERIWDHVPWEYECQALQKLFDEIPVRSPMRTPAFHLLWYAFELTKDREPLTSDRL